MTNDYGNLELHTVLLSAMKDIDRICRENGLRYYLHAGTLLGAMNHKGFIPWDDDVDISLLPDDCKKLFEIINNQWSHKYSIQTYENTPSHYSKLNKICILNTEVEYTDNSRSSIFIDVSVFHNVPRSKLLQKMQEHQLKFWDIILSVKKGALMPTSILSKMILLPLSKIPKKYIGKRLDHIMSYYDKKTTDYYALMVHHLPNPYTGMSGYHTDMVPVEICDNPKYVPFEDTNFMIYSDPTRDLVHRYGPNYWVPYPEELRKTKHGIVKYRINDHFLTNLDSERG